MARKKAWSKTIEGSGMQVRLFERGGIIYRDVTVGRAASSSGKTRTVHDVKSLKHGDRKLAEKEAKGLAREMAALQLGVTPIGSSITIAQLRALYLAQKGPLLTAYRRGEVKKAFGLFERHLAAGCPPVVEVMDLGPHQVETYAAARAAGTLKPEGAKNVAKNAGVVCINYYSCFISQPFKERTDAMWDERDAEERGIRRRVKDRAKLEPALKRIHDRYERIEHGLPRPAFGVLLDHIDHVARVAGVDHVGLGSDFDGVASLPREIDDCSMLPRVTRGLLERGHSAAAVKKILGGNVLRVMEYNEG